MTSLSLSCLLDTLSPDRATLGMRASSSELGEGTRFSPQHSQSPRGTWPEPWVLLPVTPVVATSATYGMSAMLLAPCSVRPVQHLLTEGRVHKSTRGHLASIQASLRSVLISCFILWSPEVRDCF